MPPKSSRCLGRASRKVCREVTSTSSPTLERARFTVVVERMRLISRLAVCELDSFVVSSLLDRAALSGPVLHAVLSHGH